MKLNLFISKLFCLAFTFLMITLSTQPGYSQEESIEHLFLDSYTFNSEPRSETASSEGGSGGSK